MGKLIGCCVIFAVLWSGWWFLASTTAERAVQNWLSARQSEGWQAEVRQITRSGFPVKLSMLINAPKLADPATGIALQMDHLTLSAPAWWPGDVTLTLPDTPIRMASLNGLIDLQADEGQAILHLHPGPSLQLETMEATSGLWQITTPQGALLSGSDFTTSMVQDADTPERYTLDINTKDLTPGTLLRIGVPSDWPLKFDAFTAQITATFDTAWDRHALADRRPQPRQITISDADIRWGALRLGASGDLDVDANGLPTGTLALKVEQWREAVNIAQASGVLAAGFRPQAETVLGMLANMGGDPETLNLTLSFKGGAMSMGPIPLGPAPRFVLP